MSRIKYYYDTETCKYEPVKSTLTDVIVNMLGFFAIALILAVGLVFWYSKSFPHPQIAYYHQQQIDLSQELEQQEKEIGLLTSDYIKLKDRDTTIYRQIVQAGVSKPTTYHRSKFVNNQLSILALQKTQKQQLIQSNYKSLDKLRWFCVNQSKSYQEIVEIAQQKEEMLASIPAIHPVPRSMSRYASKFGMRMHPIHRIFKMHEGIDLSAKRGTPIYAAGNGKVIKARKSLGGYGNQVEIDHGFGYETKYAHMQKFIVSVGQKVKRGELIGYVGNTGSSVAPHLHYEVKVNGVKKNPLPFLSRSLTDDEYKELLDMVPQNDNTI